ncbi:MAG: AtpZ/AtpI family protein [Lachnospiraceae bacterium]|nr:AtpZ/AtpI family protein [Lachnospiraceae bacterium]
MGIILLLDFGGSSADWEGDTLKYNKTVYRALVMITQFGVNMLVPIFLCSFAGMYLDRKLGTNIWMVALFFVGALAGFTNVFRFARKIYEIPAQTRRRSTQVRESDEKKD